MNKQNNYINAKKYLTPYISTNPRTKILIYFKIQIFPSHTDQIPKFINSYSYISGIWFLICGRYPQTKPPLKQFSFSLSFPSPFWAVVNFVCVNYQKCRALFFILVLEKRSPECFGGAIVIVLFLFFLCVFFLYSCKGKHEKHTWERAGKSIKGDTLSFMHGFILGEYSALQRIYNGCWMG